MLTKDQRIRKAITVKKLMGLLGKLPEDYLVWPNVVGNLGVLTPDEVHAGYISVSDEVLEMYRVTDDGIEITQTECE